MSERPSIWVKLLLIVGVIYLLMRSERRAIDVQATPVPDKPEGDQDTIQARGYSIHDRYNWDDDED